MKIACVVLPFYRLIESKNNRITVAMHYIAEVLYRRNHDILYINGDYGDELVPYGDRISMISNNWLFEERYKKGHSAYEDTLQIIAEYEPDVVVLGAGDVLMPTVELGSSQSCLYLADKIKQEINQNILCVGYGHLLRYEEEAHLSNLDAVITGEGEADIIDVVERGRRGMIPPSWMKDMDSLPILTNSYFYNPHRPEDWDYMMSMRGCPNRCLFCQQPQLRKGQLAYMSPKRFVEEIRYRIQNIGIYDFYFCDAIFLPGDTFRTEQMIRELYKVKKEHPQFTWRAEARVDTIIRHGNLLCKMKQSGCRQLKIGVEMMDNHMLAYMQKDINLNDVKKAFRILREMNLEATCYILLGCPGCTNEDYEQMLPEFVKLNATNYVVNITVPYEGTGLYECVKSKLDEYGLYQSGEEGFLHTSTTMKRFWGISDETLWKYLGLPGVKDDQAYRDYQRKVVDNDWFHDMNKIRYL